MKEGEQTMEIGSTLRNVMAVRDLTLQQVSDESGVPLETIRNIYYGKIENP